MRTVEHPEIRIRLGEQHVEFDLVALRGFRLRDRGPHLRITAARDRAGP